MSNLEDINRFTSICFKRTAYGQDANPLISPLSILSVLFLLAEATQGKTKNEILNSIHCNLSNQDIQKLFETSKDYRTSNKIHIQKDVFDTLVPDFIHRFTGKIFQSDDLTGLINFIDTISFESTWSKPFKDIDRDWFTNQDGSKSRCQMMHRTERMYIENQSFTGFIKSYTSPDAFMALLPKEKDYDSLLRSIEQCNFTQLFNSAYPADIEIAMPQFESRYATDLTKFLRDLGIHELFTTAADFSGISSLPLKIHKITQASQIKVDKVGTIASSKTRAIAMAGKIEYEKKTVILNRPFIYAILHFEVSSQQFIPVFVGILNQL